MGLRSPLNTPLMDDVAATLIWSRSRNVRFFCDAVFFGLPSGLFLLWFGAFASLEYPVLQELMKISEHVLKFIPASAILFGVVPVLLLAPALVCMAQWDQKRYGWLVAEAACGLFMLFAPLLFIIAMSYILHIRPALSARIESRTHV